VINPPQTGWNQLTVYAVKFGTAQKLGYVCDQATAVLEIIRNNANVKNSIPTRSLLPVARRQDQDDPRAYIWSELDHLAQKIGAWARRCRELGIEPKIKFSRRVADSSRNY
jgi:hypothetical protein